MFNFGKYFLVAVSLLSGQASASVVINRTRLVYPSDESSISVQLLNKSRTVHLVQAWIDDGNPQSRPEDVHAPFIVSPPVVKIDGEGGQTLKVLLTGSSSKLPQDRESVFWLNVLDVPPMPDKHGSNYMQVALRNRIKLFWRPAGLSIAVEDIPKYVALSRGADGKACINNKSPYYLTIVQIMRWDGKSYTPQKGKVTDNFLKKAVFVPPFSCTAPEETRGNLSSGTYQMVRIDDYGSKVPSVAKF